MAPSDPKLTILLIDDDDTEKVTVTRILRALTNTTFHLDHVERCSQALTLLKKKTYDLVLLDNRLSKRISAKFSVPIIKSAIKNAPLTIISHDISPTYLQNPTELGVDFIVDKKDMIDFLRSQINTLLGRGDGRSPISSKPV